MGPGIGIRLQKATHAVTIYFDKMYLSARESRNLIYFRLCDPLRVWNINPELSAYVKYGICLFDFARLL